MSLFGPSHTDGTCRSVGVVVGGVGKPALGPTLQLGGVQWVVIGWDVVSKGMCVGMQAGAVRDLLHQGLGGGATPGVSPERARLRLGPSRGGIFVIPGQWNECGRRPGGSERGGFFRQPERDCVCWFYLLVGEIALSAGCFLRLIKLHGGDVTFRVRNRQFLVHKSDNTYLT